MTESETEFHYLKRMTSIRMHASLTAFEHWVFWLYHKMTFHSRRTETHIFLFVMMWIYTALGAGIFVAVEGKEEGKPANLMIVFHYL